MPSFRLSTEGQYSSTGWMPGNSLSEGEMLIGVSLVTPRPKRVHLYEQNIVSFQVVDQLEGGTSRGSLTASYPGAVRPLLTWTTDRQERRTTGAG